jgi:hypothetical protein
VHNHCNYDVHNDRSGANNNRDPADQTAPTPTVQEQAERWGGPKAQTWEARGPWESAQIGAQLE